MDSMRKISIIIPCYKNSDTLRRAIESVYSQTRKVDEILVVNDCSPESDEIEAVLQNYPHVVYIKNDRNLGLSASRNIGIYAARSEIITFLDADDELHPQKIEFQLNIFKPDIAVACLLRKLENSNALTKIKPFGKEFKTVEIDSIRNIIWRNTITGASIMISRELLLNYGGYDENFRSCEDFDLWLRLLNNGIVVHNIQLPLYLYRFNKHGLSKNYFNVSYWELEVLKKHFNHQGREFLKSSNDACIWAFWLTKHLFRFEKGKDRRLKSTTKQNISLLIKHPILFTLLSYIERLRLLRLFA